MASKDIIESAESFEDFIGQTVEVGDHVVYATTSGRSPVQKFAVVERIEYVRRWNKWTEKHDAADFRVGVRELSNGRGFYRWDARVPGDFWAQDMSKVRVTFPMKANIVKVVNPE